MNKLPCLNLGCGYHFHPAWTNVDFVSTGETVLAHNLLEGIPFPDDAFDVVYHSNVLEHFLMEDGERFMKECLRVLKPGGTLRIAVPDLEQIIRQYLRIRSDLARDPDNAILEENYAWIMLELFDQAVRMRPGGAMAAYLSREKLLNEDFVISRCGIEVKDILTSCRQKRAEETAAGRNVRVLTRFSFRNIGKRLRNKLVKLLLGSEYGFYEEGKFRRSGEIHFWMYDEFSLGKLLKRIGCSEIRRVQATESRIANWNSFGLDVVNGEIRKPDSFYIEATKQ
jgi:predicted SAM-dependent methyltransferase